MDWIVAYDIREPRRLRRVARIMEKAGVRCQYSVFRFRGPRSAVRRLLEQAADVIELGEDALQAWPLGPDADDPELVVGTPRVILPDALVVADGPADTLRAGPTQSRRNVNPSADPQISFDEEPGDENVPTVAGESP